MKKIPNANSINKIVQMMIGLVKRKTDTWKHFFSKLEF